MQKIIIYKFNRCLQYLFRYLHKESWVSIYLYINLQANIKLM